MRQDLIDAFAQIVGAEHVVSSQEKIRETARNTPGGSAQSPELLIEPANAEEVSRVLALANAEKIPVFPRGSGSGPCNAAGGILLLLKRMNAILEIDTANLAAIVEPGVLIADLEQQVQKSGLMFPPDPGTYPTATIGGLAAQNSNSMKSLKYGSTKHYIMGLEIVLADGKILHTGGKNVKDVAGYDMTKLMTGSAGTLGVFTQVAVKLMPAPETKQCLFAAFSSLENAAKTVETILGANLVPAALELMDKTTLGSVAGSLPPEIAPDAEAALLIEIDGIQAVVDKDSQKITAILQSCGASSIAAAQTDEQINAFWAARRAILPAFAQQHADALVTDAIIPRSKTADMLHAIPSIAAKNNLAIAVFGHIGVGVLHPVILTNPADKNETAQISNALNAMSSLAITLGGKFSGGYLKNPAGPAETVAQQAIKNALDPNKILNPGVCLKEG